MKLDKYEINTKIIHMLGRISELILGDESIRKARETVRGLKATTSERGHMRERERKKLEEAQVITRRHALRVMVGSGALLAVAGSIGATLWPKKKEASVRRQPLPIGIPQLTPEQIQALINYQHERKRLTLQALQKFKDTNPKTKQLFEMLDKHAFYTIPLGPKVTQRIVTEDIEANPSLDPLHDEHGFEVVFMPEEFSKTLASAVVWEGQERVLRIAADFENPDWFAIVMYHELGHVWDQLWEGENPNDPVQWTDGEVRAHEVECDVLRRWQPDAYADFLKEAVPHWRTRNFQAIIAAEDKFFPSPGRSERAQAIANAALMICAAFEAGKQDGQDLNKVYSEILSSRHRRF